MEVQAGNFICYFYSNELGKIKSADGNRVFAWFHVGNTASGIDAVHFTFVLSDTEAKQIERKNHSLLKRKCILEHL